MKYQEIIYYTDELTDDFGNKPKKNHPLPKKYKYMTTSFLSRFFTSIIYQIMLQPLAYVYVKLRFHQKFKNHVLYYNADTSEVYVNRYKDLETEETEDVLVTAILSISIIPLWRQMLLYRIFYLLRKRIILLLENKPVL